MNNNQLKKLPVNTSINPDCWDWCNNCGDETNLSRLNLVNGLCPVCDKGRVNYKLDKETINKLLALDVGLKCT